MSTTVLVLGHIEKSKQNLENYKELKQHQKNKTTKLLRECLVLTQKHSKAIFVGFPCFCFEMKQKTEKDIVLVFFWMDMINQDLNKKKTHTQGFSFFWDFSRHITFWTIKHPWVCCFFWDLNWPYVSIQKTTPFVLFFFHFKTNNILSQSQTLSQQFFLVLLTYIYIYILRMYKYKKKYIHRNIVFFADHNS